MPKTDKYVSTRSQPKRLYLLAVSALLLASVCGIGKEYNFNLLNELASPFRHSPPIVWRTREAALAESGRTGKPILYAILVKGDDASIRMEYDDFNKKDTYEFINANYIPVRIFLKEKITEESKTPLEFKAFSEQFPLSYRSSVALFTVPAKLRMRNHNDILSSANLAELGISEPNLYGHQNYQYYNNYEPAYSYYGRSEGGNSRGPVLNVYRTHEDLMEYLFAAKNWHYFKPSTGLVHWQPAKLLDGPKPAKPRVLLLLDDIGQESDHFRLNSLYNREVVDLLNKNCTPILLEYDTEHPERNKTIDQIKNKYGLTSLPATVFVDAKDGKDDVIRGNAAEQNICEFLRNGLGLKASVPDNTVQYASHKYR
jgi:hypothetical protein